MSRDERTRFAVVLVGDYPLPSFTKRELRWALASPRDALAKESEKQPRRSTRRFRGLYAHGLITNFPHARRWRVSLTGHRTMTTVIKLREVAYRYLSVSAA